MNFRPRQFILVLLLLASICLLILNSAQMQSPLRRITNTSEEGLNLNPSMSGDGRIVAFESTEDVAGAGGLDAFRAIRANVSVDPPTFIQMGVSRAPAPAISQDGSRIAFGSNADPLGSNPDGNSEIFLYDGAKLIQITNTSPGNIANRAANGNFLPSISDDGRFVAFSSNRNLTGQNADGNLEIFISDTVAGGFTQLTSASGIVGFTDAKISGDGTSVAYIRDNGAAPSVNRDLLLQNRTGAPSLRTLATNGQKLAMTFGRAISDDGKRVVWSAETATNSSQVFLYDGRNNETRQITSLGSRVTEVPLHPTINGNGTRIAFAARRSVSGAGSNSDGSVELYTHEIPSATFGRVTNTTSNDATADVLSSMNDDGSVIAFNFPRVLTGVSNEEMANNSEIYVTGTPPRPDFGTLRIVNGASFGHEPATTEAVAPDSIAVAFGTLLANCTQQSQKLPNGTFPTTVCGTTVTVNGRPAQIFFVSPSQVNFLVPPETELGSAEVIVTNPEGFPSRGTVASLLAAPGIFTFTGDGLGEGVILNADTLQPGPFDPTNGDLRLIIFSTGVRNALQVSVTAGGRELTVESVIRSPDMPGFDEVHVLVPADLRGAGPVDLIMRADLRDSNPVEVSFDGSSQRDIVINEFLADPPGSAAGDLQGDANHDGERSASADEFIELVNSTTRDIDISGYQIFTRGAPGSADVLRHTFPAGTILRSCTAIVVFGGGDPDATNPVFGGAQIQKASSGAVTLSNASGVITLRDQTAAVAGFVAYGGSTPLEADDNQSLTRAPDITGTFAKHLAASGGARAFSPGTQLSGAPFASCSTPIARVEVSPASAAIDAGTQQQFTAKAFDAGNNEVPGVIFFWESSNTSVATIDQSGLATGVSAGTAQIRATGRGVQSPPATLTVNAVAPPNVIINEVDSDQAGTDTAEFVELYDGGTGNTSLTGLVVVFYNGSDDHSYAAFDLDGATTNANGYFTLGNAGVPGVDRIFGDGLMQNGADAVALYVGNASDFPNGTSVTTTNLIDALVYDTNDADDAGLLALLNAGQPQVNEDVGGNGTTNSNQRCPNASGGPRNTETYAQFAPTADNANVCVVQAPPPDLTINDVSVAEGNSGTTTLTFTVSLSSAAPAGGVTFDIATADNTATVANNDYVAKSLTSQTIATGSQTYDFVVTVNGDLDIEPNENFFVNVTNVSGATVVDGQGSGTIQNDDSPTLSINDVSANEGDSGTTTFTFTVTSSLPAPAGGITFDIATQDNTATVANNDYVARSLTSQTIPATQTTYTFDVTVNGDTSVEAPETFFVNVTNASGATIGDGQGVGTIQNDDAALVVISQVYGGGGNASATFTHDFIELFNRGTTTVDLTGWSVQYTSATGSTWQVTNISGTLQPGQYYLIQEASNAAVGSPLPTPDATGTIVMAAGAGKVALVNTTSPLSGVCPSGAGIMDFVGYGTTANCFEGSGPAPAPSATTSDHRANGGCTDTNNNAADFFSATPTPRNTSSPLNNCTGADLALTKSDSPDPVITGSDVTYTIVVTNNGFATAQFVVVTDNLPASVTFVSCSSTGTGVCGGTLNNRTVTFASLANGTQETITLVATANGAGGSTTTNTATVASSTNDPNAANNSAQTITTVANLPSADLSITKADSPDPVTPGGTLTYTLTVTNGGPDAAQSVVVTDTLSSDVSFVDCSSDQGGVCGGTATSPTVSFSSLANGVTATITIHVTASNSLTTGAVISNTASVSSTTADPASGNNSDSEDTTVQVATATVTSVVVSPDAQTINRGGTQQFTATAFNGATPVPGATFTWGSSNTNVATIDTNGLATGVGIGTTTITATTSDGIGGNVSGTATLTVQVPLVINEINADVAADDLATTAIEGDSNRDGTRSDDDDEFVELLNNSNAAVNVSGVVVADATSNRFTFPANTTVAAGQAVIIFGGGTPPISDPAFGGALIFTTTSLGLNNTADTVTVKLNVGGSDVVIDTHTYAGEANNNQSITQSPDAEVGSAGGSFVQHTTATNAAGRVFSPGTRADGTPFGSPAITRIEVLPVTAAIAVGATQVFTGHAYSNVGGPEIEVLNVSFIWDSSDTGKATVAPTTGQTTTATAVAAGSSTIRARAGGQQGTATLTVNAPTPTLNINDISQVETNGTTTFTFQVSLSSAAPAGGVTFDIATADGTAQDDNPATEDNDYVAQTVTGATILEGNTTYDFIVTVNGDAVVEPDETFFVNVTNVTGANLGDGQGQGTIQNDDTNSADLSLSKTVDNPTPVVGQNVVFTITLNNGGTSTATGVQVTDLLPSGLGYVSSTVSQGTYTDGTGIWDVGTVAVGSPAATLTITATAQSVGAKINNSEVTASTTPDPDSTPNDGIGDDFSSVTVTPGAAASADLSLTKTVNNSTPNIGERVTFTVTLNNAGPSAANGVQVTDLLPAGLLYVSSTVTQGTYTNGTGIWDVGTAAVGSPSATLTITATVQTVGGKTNTAQVTASTTPDPDSTPNDGMGDDFASAVVTGASNLVINEVVTAPPSSSPPADANDFVELYNKSATQSIDISGLVISSRASASTTTVNTFTLPGTPGSGTTVIPANSYLIIVNGTSAYGTTADFNASASSFNLTATSGGVKIELDGVKLDGLAYQSSAANVVPATFAAFGEGTVFISPVASGLQDYIRSPNGTDTNDNASDFRRNGTTANVSERAANPTIP